ncbi:MAG: hypothetical protein P4L84_33395 [Isosphaeraceae bacterium]|nr:hypothetical protein [Isosphaeraceae bacterium]
MELTFECPGCRAVNNVRGVESSPAVKCRSCAREHALRGSAWNAEGIVACPWCATEDLYLQKDFPQGLGLFIVLVGFGISTVFWYYENPVPAYLVLLASALIDLVLYYRVPDVTICYRCLCQFRGPGSNPLGRFHPFDLAVGERYRQERIRIEQLRQQQTSANPPV